MEYRCRQFYGFKSLADVLMNYFADLHGIKIITVSKLRYSIFFDAVVFHMLFCVLRLLYYIFLWPSYTVFLKYRNLSPIGQN